MALDPMRAMRRTKNREAADAQNAARLAWSYGKATSTGWGEFRIPTMIEFDVSFVEEPFVSYSNYVSSDQLVDTRFPRCWAGVYRWNIVQGRWTGAWVYLVVETQGVQLTTTVVADPGYYIEHHFSFAGIALKDVPVNLLSVPPHRP